MTRPALNKTSLKNQRDGLKLYQQYLPSLDLKRQQFLAELHKAKERVAETQDEMNALEKNSDAWLPFLAGLNTTFDDVFTIKKVRIKESNLLGLTVSHFEAVDIEIRDHSLLASPLWLDSFLAAAIKSITLHLKIKVEQQNIAQIQEALQTITQRVNLFDKVLIPSAQKNIRRIQIALSDMERAGVVRSKLAKSKRIQHDMEEKSKHETEAVYSKQT